MKKIIYTAIVIVIQHLAFNIQHSFAQAANDNTGSGNSLSFDGNDYVDCGPIGTSTQGTMEAWIKPGGNYSGTQWVLGAIDGGSDVNARYCLRMIHTSVCSNQWSTTIGNGSTSQHACSGLTYNATNFPSGVWTHLAITFDGSNVRFYKDGILQNTAPQTVGAAGVPNTFSIGRAGDVNGGYFNGQIDEARIWDKALSQAEIKDNMCNQLQGNESNLVGYWKMNEGTGGTVTDLTSNGNDGTLN